MIGKMTVFDDRAMLLASAYAFTSGALQDALKTRGDAVLLGAGGSTPVPLYERLSRAELDWKNVTIGLTDERWVPADHEASNEAMLRRTLLQNRASAATFLSMVTDPARVPSEEYLSVNATYTSAAMACDAMILGMGSDAHTLSWFPGAYGLGAALNPENTNMVTAIRAIQSTVTGAFTDRMTLTVPAVSQAKRILLLITGAEKRSVLETSTAETPVQQMIKAAGDRLSIYWTP